MTTTALTLAPAVDRDAGGRFLKGNCGGPGNPHAKQIARLKSALHEALTEDGIAAVAQAMLQRAKGGDVAAARLLLEYAIGKPVAGSTATVLDSEMTEHILAERLTSDELATLMKLQAKLQDEE